MHEMHKNELMLISRNQMVTQLGLINVIHKSKYSTPPVVHFCWSCESFCSVSWNPWLRLDAGRTIKSLFRTSVLMNITVIQWWPSFLLLYAGLNWVIVGSQVVVVSGWRPGVLLRSTTAMWDFLFLNSKFHRLDFDRLIPVLKELEFDAIFTLKEE